MTIGWQNKFIIIVFVLAVIGGICCIDLGHDWGDDFALYLSQMKAISEGSMDELLKVNKFSMDNSSFLIGPYLYPQGFPLFLLLFYKIAGMNLLLFKWVNWSFFLLSSVLYYQLVRAQTKVKFSSLFASLLVGCVILHPKFLEASDRLLSDLLFTSLGFWFFYLIRKKEFGFTNLLLIGFVIFVAMNTRSTGILLLPVFFIALINSTTFSVKNIFQINFLKSIIVVFVVAFGCDYLLKIWFPDGTGNHWAMLKDIRYEVILANLDYYYLMFGRYLIWHAENLLGPSILLRIVYGLILMALILAGYKTFRNFMEIWIFVLLNIPLLLIWPSQQGMRFLFPLIPLILLPVFDFYFELIQRKYDNRILLFSIFSLIVFISVQGFMTMVYYYKLNTNQAYTNEARELYAYVRNSIPKNEIIEFNKPRLLYLETGRISVRKGNIDSLIHLNVNYYIENIKDVKQQKTNQIGKLMFNNSNFRVFKLRQ